MKAGELHFNWQGGKKSHRTGTVNSFTSRQVKPGSVCADCGSTDRLQAHHIQRVVDRPDLATDETNIQILCAPCHAIRHPESAALILRVGTFKPPVECVRCGILFLKKANRVKARNWCSRICYYADPHRKVRGGILSDHAANRKPVLNPRTRPNAPPSPRVAKVCEVCRTGFEVCGARKDKARYCSHACRLAGLNARWKAGHVSPSVPSQDTSG
jgi:hypothetical protein